MLAEAGELLKRALTQVLGALEVAVQEVLGVQIIQELLEPQEQAEVGVVVTINQPMPLVVQEVLELLWFVGPQPNRHPLPLRVTLR